MYFICIGEKGEKLGKVQEAKKGTAVVGSLEEATKVGAFKFVKKTSQGKRDKKMEN